MGGIRPDPTKVEAVQKIAAPKTRKQLQSFLGMMNYIRTTISNHAEVTAPLSSLTSAKSEFRWTQQHEEAFKKCKQAVMKATMLSFPDFKKPFLIFTDASKEAIGSVIFQRNENGDLKAPTAFFSKKLTDTQKSIQCWNMSC